MSKILETSFTAYDLTDEEVLRGSILNTLQLQVLQNHLSIAAEEKISLEYDPSNTEVFLQQEAYLKSKIDLLTYLKDTSKASEEALTNDSSGE